MSHIKDSSDYGSEFPTTEMTVETLRSNALKTALDTRKFEIDLYWKRATYFWAFIAASLTAFFVVRTSTGIEDYKYMTIIIACIGYLFSLGWYLVNRGSKFWQENWERHVSNLEQDIQGPLFANVKIPEKFSFWKPLEGFPFSVSKVNQLLSLAMTLFWLAMIGYSLLFTFDRLEWFADKITCDSIRMIFAIWILAILGVTIVMLCYTQSFVVKAVSNLNKEERKNWLFTSKKPNDERGNQSDSEESSNEAEK